MDWLSDTLLIRTSVQAIIVICFICALGLSVARFRFRGVSLGVTYVFFAGILAGTLGNYFHEGQPLIDSAVLDYAETFGLVFFVYTLGLQVGPAFFSAFKQGGTQLNFLAIGTLAIGTLIALVLLLTTDTPLPDMMGILSGATTNTPALGAAQQALKQIGQPSSSAALATAVTYTFGMVGVIFALMLMKGWLISHDKGVDVADSSDETFVGGFSVSNPAVYGMALKDIDHKAYGKFTITRLWRKGKVTMPNGDTRLEAGDRLLVILQKRNVQKCTLFFGLTDDTDWNKDNIDWNALDDHYVSEHVLITNPHVNGRSLATLGLRQRYGVTVSRVKRAGLRLIASPDLTLRIGDKVTIVGERGRIESCAKELGNTVQRLDEPNMVTIFVGIVLGLLIGALPLWLPGMNYPVRLGLAGGPIVMGILIGAFGPRVHMITYTTSSANLMLRSLGLSMYLGCLGLDAGSDFLQTVMQPQALMWIFYALLITFIPLVIMGVISVVFFKNCYATTAGMLCGAMANPIALNYVNETTEGDKASVAYASVYPLSMFLRVIIAQIFVLWWFA